MKLRLVWAIKDNGRPHGRPLSLMGWHAPFRLNLGDNAFVAAAKKVDYVLDFFAIGHLLVDLRDRIV